MYYIICKNEVQGFHQWSGAPDNQKFLKAEHRHIFAITTKIAVNHADRDLEIIETQDSIEAYLHNKYGNPCKFGGMSCEMIAEEIAERFGAFEVEVLEDGYGGAAYRE